MDALRRTSTALVGMLLACAVITAPSLSYADRDGKKHRKHHRQASHRDHDRYRDYGRARWGDDDRYDGRRYRQYHRSPQVSIGVQFGTPVCRPVYQPVYVPVRTYCPPPRPVVYVPVQYDDGYYYDRECGRRFSNLELYFEHVSAGGSASVHIRN